VAYGSTNNPDHTGIADLNLREVAALAPLFVFVLWIGFHPQPFLDLMQTSVDQVVHHVGRVPTALR
jgi:NADH-quinone oxidoreductase subunit M